MSESKIGGSITYKLEDGKTRVIDVKTEGLPGRGRRSDWTHTAGVSIAAKSGGGFQSCEIVLWGEVPCTESEFWSLDVHRAAQEKLQGLLVELLLKFEQEWIPEEHQAHRGEKG